VICLDIRRQFAILLALVLSSWLGLHAADRAMPDKPSVLMSSIEHDGQCLDAFFAARRAQDQTSSSDRLQLYLDITLMPGCKGRPDSPWTGAWPRFSNDLNFEFGLTQAPEGTDRRPRGEQSFQKLPSELVEDERSVWEENFTMRTLHFKVWIDRPLAVTDDLAIQILTGKEKIRIVTLPVPTSRADKKARKNRT